MVEIASLGSTDNHATSGLKFAVLHEFLSAGCSVLLSDVDVLWMQNPFTLPSLYRDADVEGMTDGWDDVTAYGYEWPSHTRSLRLGARNSGLFYVRATVEAVRMMARLKGRMQREARPPARPHVVPCTFSPPRPPSRPRPPPSLAHARPSPAPPQAVWDQTAYNEEMWWAALPREPAHGIAARVMNYLCHMNSKTFFRYMREDDQLLARHRPVSLHINYHPEKLPRMEDAFARYHGAAPDVDLGNGLGQPTKRAAQGGIHAWHWGVGLKAGKWCREAPRVRGAPGSTLGGRLVAAGGRATWSGISGLHFHAGGALDTPWGSGSWGTLKKPGAEHEDLLFADFIGQQHVVGPHADGWPRLTSTRCADFENVTVVVHEGG